jgi:hypothetical protein
MLEAVQLTSEQRSLIRHLAAESEHFSLIPAMRRDPVEIDQARLLIGEAVAARVPRQAYANLETLVGRYDQAMRMPAHLRNLCRL